MLTIASSNDLDRLAVKCGTDKYAATHYYTPIYNTLWRDLRNTPITLLEIGVKNGASLRMWEQYFPLAEIHGIDNNASCRKHASERSKVWTCDQTDAEALWSIAEEIGALDIVIDDGSHRTPDQVVSLETLWPCIRQGGWYAIEDLSACFMEHYGGGLGKPETTIERVKRLMDEMHFGVTHSAKTLPCSQMANELAGIYCFAQLVILQKRFKPHNHEEE